MSNKMYLLLYSLSFHTFKDSSFKSRGEAQMFIMNRKSLTQYFKGLHFQQFQCPWCRLPEKEKRY